MVCDKTQPFVISSHMFNHTNYVLGEENTQFENGIKSHEILGVEMNINTRKAIGPSINRAF